MNEQRGKGEGIMTAGQNKDGGKVLRYPPGRWKQRSPVPLARVMVIVGRYTSSVDAAGGVNAILVKEDGWNFVVDQFSTMRLFIET